MPKLTDELKEYQALREGDGQEVSVYIAATKHYVEHPSVELITQRLETLLMRKDVEKLLDVSLLDNGSFKVVLLSNQQLPFLYYLTFEDNVDNDNWTADVPDYVNTNLQQDERLEMHQSPQTVEIMTYLDDENPQHCVMLQLAVLNAVAGESYAVLDPIIMRYFSGAWLADIAESYTPISPLFFYTIHAVGSDEEQGEPNNIWLHTHGLLKFNVPELEILKGNAESLSTYPDLINALAKTFICHTDRWYTEEVISAGFSQGKYIDVGLMPWQQAIHSKLLVEKKGLFFKKELPFNGNEADRDDIHSKPSLVIFASINEQLKPLSAYGDAVKNDEQFIVFLPDAETERMSQIAQEKLPILLRCFNRFPPSEDWHYMAKLFCHSPETDASEHMWFNIIGETDSQLKVELISHPFDIPEMQTGKTYVLPFEQVTDWYVTSVPLEARISPDEAFILKRYLNAH